MTPIRTHATMALIWFRADIPRAQAVAHWRGHHASLVATTPGIDEYRQHHLERDAPGLWPAHDGIDTAIAPGWRLDGVPEVTFAGALSPLKAVLHNRHTARDEASFLARTLLYLTGPGGGRWLAGDDDARVGLRAVALLRRRPETGFASFRRWVNDGIGPALAAAPGVRELRTLAFLPWWRRAWNTPGVAHDNPPAGRYHAAIVIGAADRAALVDALASPPVAATVEEQRHHCAAIHAHVVAHTHVYRRGGQPVGVSPSRIRG
jgi:hypothetical protein